MMMTPIPARRRHDMPSPTLTIQPLPTFRMGARQHSAQYRTLCCCALVLVLSVTPLILAISISLTHHFALTRRFAIVLSISPSPSPSLPSHDDNDMITAPLQLSCHHRRRLAVAFTPVILHRLTLPLPLTSSCLMTDSM